MTEQPELQQGLTKLAQKILKMEKPVLGSQKKMMMRANLLKQMSTPQEDRIPATLQGVVDYIKELVSMLNLDMNKRVDMKERVFAAIENIPQRSYFWRNFWIFNKKMISGLAVVTMFLGMFSFISVDTSVVRAETFTVLDSFLGQVVVVRDGKSIAIHSDMELYEGDKIATGNDGMVVVKYFDDSITRLSSDTTVVIDKLFKPQNSVQTYIEVSLESGTMWSHVLSLVGDDSAFVLKANDVSATAKKATFNAELKDQKLELEVFNRSVDIQKQNQLVDKVIRGQKAVINGKVEVVDLSENDKNVAWVQENLESDKEYLVSVEDRLLAAKMKSMGTDAPKDVSMGNSLRENIAVFLTFDDVSKVKKEFDLAEKNLVAAEIKLADPNLSATDKQNVQKAMQDFSDKVKMLDKIVKEVGYSDEKYSAELKQYLDNGILAHQKDLSLVLPDSPLYEVKQMVDNVALIGVSDKTELAEKKLEQLSDKLATAEDAAMLGQTQVARETVDDSKKELAGVMEMINTIDSKVPEAKEDLVGKVSEVQQYLTAVSDEAAVATTTVVSTETPVVVTNTEVTPVGIVTTTPVEPTINTSVEDNYGVFIQGDKPLPPGLGN
jgi:hypothetical protein